MLGVTQTVNTTTYLFSFSCHASNQCIVTLKKSNAHALDFFMNNMHLGFYLPASTKASLNFVNNSSALISVVKNSSATGTR